MKSKHVTLWLAVAVLAVFAMAASSPQCARTTENPMIPSLQPLGQSPCNAGCLDAFKTDKAAEKTRFKAAMAACNGDLDCRAAESEIHNLIVAELVVVKDDCLLDCQHQQGAGTGGQ